MDQSKLREIMRNQQMLEALTKRYNAKPASTPAAVSGGARGLEQKFSHGILAGFRPGNIGDINQVIWPFFFPFSATQDVNPGQSTFESFSVTQEAAFLWRYTIKAVFEFSGGDYTYIDPYNFDESVNNANGLKMVIRDAQSTREFHGRTFEDVDNIGTGNFPSLNPSTVLLLPNQTMQIQFTNSDPARVYRPFVVFVGYRVRLEDAQKILSTVSL